MAGPEGVLINRFHAIQATSQNKSAHCITNSVADLEGVLVKP